VPRYSSEKIAEVLAATDIVDIVGAHVELKPAGHGRFTGLCPFHTEKTPSFSVSRERQMYYCFGCGKSGDAYRFLQENESLSFVDAVKRLAERAGIALPVVSAYESQEDAQRAQLVELCKFAQKHFRENLESALKGGLGRKYLATRKLKDETAKKFGLGYALDGWDNLVSAARGAKFKDNLIETGGLARRGERGTIYDFFRNRLMFPIRDISGHIVAFGGRDLAGDKNAAKYINTNEGPLYKKGRTLYGLFEAREALRHSKQALLVEGYFDLLRCVDAGVENVVASCGTALTVEQANLLHRYVREVVLVYDGDAAGIRAALRGVGILVGAGLSVRVLALPEGQDPDDFILEKGREAFDTLVDTALDFVSFHVQMNADRSRTIEGRTEVARELFSTFASIDDDLRRAEYIKLAAKALGLDGWNLAQQFRDYTRGKETPDAARSTEKAQPTFRPIGVSREHCLFVQALLHSGPLLEQVRASMDEIAMTGPIREIVEALLGGVKDVGHVLESDDARHLFAAAANLGEYDQEQAEIVVDKFLKRLRQDNLLAERKRSQDAMRAAERANQMDEVKSLMTRIMSINQKLQKIGAV
jgi:DNA primase